MFSLLGFSFWNLITIDQLCSWTLEGGQEGKSNQTAFDIFVFYRFLPQYIFLVVI